MHEPANGFEANHDIKISDGRWFRLTFTAPPALPLDTRIVTATDISDLKTDYYRQLLDTFQDCIKVIDNKGRLIFLNPAGRSVLSVAPDQPLGMPWTSLLPPAVAPKVQQILEQVLAGEPAQFSNHSQVPGSEAQTWHHVLTPYRASDGHVVAALCISRNITQDYDSHRATRVSEERMAAAIKAAPWVSGKWT